MNIASDKDLLPWYRQFWPWFLIALPGSAVIAGFITLYIAMHEADTLVAGDYYKEGLAINQSLGQTQAAARLGVSALLRYTPENAEITAQLQVSGVAFDTPLTLALVHPTRAQLDRSVYPEPAGAGLYRVSTGALAAGNWHIALGDRAGNWLLRGRIHLPEQRQVMLRPDTLIQTED